MNARSHEEYKENIGAYVLGALPELEAELLEFPSYPSCCLENVSHRVLARAA